MVSLVLLLTTIGRKTGHPRTLPLIYIEEGDDIVVVASRGGLPSEPLWYKNLVANPECNVQIKRREPLAEDVARAVVESGRGHQVIVARSVKRCGRSSWPTTRTSQATRRGRTASSPS